jgi:hypothetical protein
MRISFADKQLGLKTGFQAPLGFWVEQSRRVKTKEQGAWTALTCVYILPVRCVQLGGI